MTCCTDGNKRSKRDCSCQFRITASIKNMAATINTCILEHTCLQNTSQSDENVSTKRLRNSSIKVFPSIGSSILDITDNKLVKGSNWRLGEDVEGDICDSIISSVLLYETEVYGITKYQVHFSIFILPKCLSA